MALSINSNYAGEVLQAFITKAAVGNDTVDKGIAYVKSDIPKEYSIPRMGLGGIIQARQATPSTPKGTFTVDEKKLAPQDFMVYTEFNPSDFDEFWRWAQPEGALVFHKLNPEAQVAMVGEIFKELNRYLGVAFWMGRKAIAGTFGKHAAATVDFLPGDVSLDYDRFDGFLTKILDIERTGTAGDNIIKAGNTKIETGAEVLTALDAVFTSIPKAIRGAKDVKIVLDWNLFDMYDKALIDLPNKGRDLTATNSKRYRGVPIEVLNGMPEQTIVAGRLSATTSSNFWIGIDAVSDAANLVVEKKQANSELFFFKMLLKADTQIPQPSELVVWTPFTLT